MGVEGVIHFKIWEVLFRDMGGAVLGGGGGGDIHPEIWEVLCWGVEGVIHFEIWEVPFRDMGGAEMCCGRREDSYVVLVT